MIIQNAIQILEGNEKFLVSSHVHDFRTHTFEDGTSISVDGGYDYIKRCFPEGDTGYGKKWYGYSLNSSDPFDTIKERLLWGTRGIDGKQPLNWVRLIDCSTTHLQAILEYPYQIGKTLSPIYTKVIKHILSGRDKMKEIEIIHKSCRPKYNYVNPRLCFDPNTDEIELFDSAKQSEYHKNSRVKWDKVTCPKCLKLRIEN